ncbi:MAG: hypothetical protein HC769_35190 [Cyanobacteria bacterium CRU_2_1]|nr:hypothetical protein [Cyanobacteria bacterium RU_5_0]NJR63569.1 hypothetical protein [Cyanobacteria bacterium CRU_2_1]
MTYAITHPQRKLTFAEFLDYDDGTDNRYELIDGIPILMPEPSKRHEKIVDYLSDRFKAEIARSNLPWYPSRRLIQIPVGGLPTRIVESMSKNLKLLMSMQTLVSPLQIITQVEITVRLNLLRPPKNMQFLLALNMVVPVVVRGIKLLEELYVKRLHNLNMALRTAT